MFKETKTLTSTQDQSYDEGSGYDLNRVRDRIFRNEKIDLQPWPQKFAHLYINDVYIHSL